MVWYGMVLYGMVWYGIILETHDYYQRILDLKKTRVSCRINDEDIAIEDIRHMADVLLLKL